ncbi:MAG: response regulator transcription factor [Bacteroidetes bacterium]|nr:response regulator transcription factor [Bacteroidota bacterium]
MAKKTKTILCVDDEQDILDILSYNLRKEGYTVFTADDGEKALQMAEKVKPDLVVIDIMMPGKDGLEVCKSLRNSSFGKDTPIMFLTAKADEIDEIIGLEFGADDYVTKPFSPRKIVARIKAMFRRVEMKKELHSEQKAVIKAGGIEINRITYTVTVDGEEIKFLHKEFELLYFLMNRPGMVFSRNNLLYHVWGEDAFFVDRTVDVHVTKIRKKLGAYGDMIETIRGVGYKFISNGKT